jgi:hypothetical protein
LTNAARVALSDYLDGGSKAHLGLLRDGNRQACLIRDIVLGMKSADSRWILLVRTISTVTSQWSRTRGGTKQHDRALLSGQEHVGDEMVAFHWTTFADRESKHTVER